MLALCAGLLTLHLLRPKGNCTWETSPQFRDTLESSPNRSAPSMIAMKSAGANPFMFMMLVAKEFSQ
jgi:hypothetical protein